MSRLVATSKNNTGDGTTLRNTPRAKSTSTNHPRTAGTSSSKSATPAPYHHGALHEALLTAAERVLVRDGLAGLTLRAAAREAGVSHAAPTHHFGDLTGLLSDLAAVGFRRFRAELLAAADEEISDNDSLDAMGGAYVAFAKRYPGMFMLMFRSERLDIARPALAKAMGEASAALAQAVGGPQQETFALQEISLTKTIDMLRAWSLVHGFAMLLLDGRLAGFLAHLPPGENDETLLRKVLQFGQDVTKPKI